MDNDIIKSLSSLSEEINAAKKEEAIFQGRLSEIEDRLQNDFGFTTVQEAKYWIQKEERELAVLEKKIEVDYKSLREKYEW
jgi:hypothetical protein